MGLLILAAFWLGVALFLLIAPDEVFKSSQARTRRYGAVGCAIFAAFCVIGYLAT
jgi:hypothetical protein